MPHSSRINWEAVARSDLHRIRLAILEHLAERGIDSPKGMAEKFREPLGNVSYHVKVFSEAGLLTIVRTEPRRGAVEHFHELSEKATESPYAVLLEAFHRYINEVCESPVQVGEALRNYLPDEDVEAVVEALKGAAEPEAGQ